MARRHTGLRGRLQSLRKTASQARRMVARAGPGGLLPLYRQHWATRARPELVEPRINAIQIEPSKRCNQRCPMCTQPTLAKDQKGDMTLDQLRHIVDQLPNLIEAKLQGLGEIFLNREIWEMLELLVARRIRVLFATNGVLMSRESARRLCELGELDVRFSIDSVDPQRYARIRGVDSYERVRENVAEFCEVRRARGRKRGGRLQPTAEIRMVCMDENLHELPRMVEFAAEVGLDQVTATFLLSKRHSDEQSKVADERSGHLTREGLGAAEQEARRKAERLGVRLHKIPYTDDILEVCDWPWRMPYITYDGFLTTCCHVENPAAGNLGNIFESPFEEIWNGPAYRSLRRHFTDLSRNHLCRICPYLPAHLTEDDDAEAEGSSAPS